MKLESTATTYFVEHGGCHYRTTNGKDWERLYGQTWEQEYHAEHALTSLFATLCIRRQSLDKWNLVMWALGKLYLAWTKNNAVLSDQVNDLMDAYDDFLD